MECRILAFIIRRRQSGRRHSHRRLRQRRQRLQFRTRPVPIRHLNRIQLAIRRTIGTISTILLNNRALARLHSPNIEKTRRRRTRILRKSLRITPSNKLLRLPRMLRPVTIQKKRQSREHPQSHNPNRNCNRNGLRRLGLLRRSSRDRHSSIGRRRRRLSLILSGRRVMEKRRNVGGRVRRRRRRG